MFAAWRWTARRTADRRRPGQSRERSRKRCPRRSGLGGALATGRSRTSDQERQPGPARRPAPGWRRPARRRAPSG
ncbi:hypothetical protein DYH09_11250 [bacterium CPR1]|nr:hypothetical protein [bacterium CPR1]